MMESVSECNHSSSNSIFPGIVLFAVGAEMCQRIVVDENKPPTTACVTVL